MQTPRPLRDFMPLVLPYVEGCPIPTAEQAVRLSAIEWCERTRCWRSITQGSIDSSRQALVAPMWAAIHEIESATFGDEDRPLEPVQYSQVEPSEMEENGPSCGVPRHITQASPNHISVIPFAKGIVRLSMFLKPRSGPDFDGAQNIVPDHIFTQDAEVIAHGALHRLYAMPGRPWSDTERAAFYLSRFEARADKKFASAIRGQHKARIRTRAHFM